MTEYAVKTQRLSKQFGANRALDSLSLTVPRGSIFGLLGPNGAGKTTTLQMLVNLIAPDSGTARILEYDAQTLPASAFLSIGYVSENQQLPEWMSVARFLEYCEAMYPKWDKEFASALIQQFSLPMEQKLRSLSRGMRMKAALISALAFRPRLLILDEPFSGLDPLVRDELIDGMLEFTGTEEWTILISSHDIAEIERIADRIGILNRGALHLAEETDQLQRRFRLITASLAGEEDLSALQPDTWICFEQSGKAIRFIHTAYEEGVTEDELYTFVPGLETLSAAEMPLRDIFVSIARQFKLSDER